MYIYFKGQKLESALERVILGEGGHHNPPSFYPSQYYMLSIQWYDLGKVQEFNKSCWESAI